MVGDRVRVTQKSQSATSPSASSQLQARAFTPPVAKQSQQAASSSESQPTAPLASQRQTSLPASNLLAFEPDNIPLFAPDTTPHLPSALSSNLASTPKTPNQPVGPLTPVPLGQSFVSRALDYAKGMWSAESWQGALSAWRDNTAEQEWKTIQSQEQTLTQILSQLPEQDTVKQQIEQDLKQLEQTPVPYSKRAAVLLQLQQWTQTAQEQLNEIKQETEDLENLIDEIKNEFSSISSANIPTEPEAKLRKEYTRLTKAVKSIKSQTDKDELTLLRDNVAQFAITINSRQQGKASKQLEREEKQKQKEATEKKKQQNALKKQAEKYKQSQIAQQEIEQNRKKKEENRKLEAEKQEKNRQKKQTQYENKLKQLRQKKDDLSFKIEQIEQKYINKVLAENEKDDCLNEGNDWSNQWSELRDQVNQLVPPQETDTQDKDTLLQEVLTVHNKGVNVRALQRKIYDERAIAVYKNKPEPDPANFSQDANLAPQEFYERRELFKALVFHDKVTLELPPPNENNYPYSKDYGTEYNFVGLNEVWVLHVHWSKEHHFEKAHYKKRGMGREFKSGGGAGNDVDLLTMKYLKVVDSSGYNEYPWLNRQ